MKIMNMPLYLVKRVFLGITHCLNVSFTDIHYTISKSVIQSLIMIMAAWSDSVKSNPFICIIT